MGGFKKSQGVWIARDQNGELYAYVVKPKKRTSPITKMSKFIPNGVSAFRHSLMRLPNNWYKNIKFENSPVFVPLTEDFVE